MSPEGDMKLVVESVAKEFATGSGKLAVLKNASLSAGPGETVAVVGPSGSGKSTLLNIIGALEAPSAGKVTLGDIEVTALKGDALAEYRAKRVGFVFQDHHLLPQCTAIENVMLPTLAAGRTEGARERAQALLARVGLADKAETMPGVLSGGERQRVAIARALVNDPGLLLADEPTGNLDADSAKMIVELFIELARERRVTLLMVTHNMELAGMLGRVTQLRDGMLHEAKV